MSHSTAFRRRHSAGPTTQTNADVLRGFTIYELMFELIGRLKEGGLTTASTRQLLIVGRACVEELSTRAQKKEG
jgi:hypothetical protein